MIPFSPVEDSCLLGVFYSTAAYCYVHCCYDDNGFTLMMVRGAALHDMMEVDCCIFIPFAFICCHVVRQCTFDDACTAMSVLLI